MNTAVAHGDIDTVKAMRAARQAFSDGITRFAKLRRQDLLRRLRSDSVYKITEFFFLLKCHEIRTVSQVKAFARLHNEYLQDAMNTPEKLEKLDRTKSQIDGAFFSDLGIEKLGENFRRNPPSFDQSDLCRFLVTQQSFENCRRSLKVLRETGLLEEEKIPYGSLVLHSPGVLEQIYRDHLGTLRAMLPRRDQE